MDSSVINARTIHKCRACLTDKGSMKNMYESKVHEDFHNITEIQVKRSEGITEMLCKKCEASLQQCVKFKVQCHRSNLILQQAANQSICTTIEPIHTEKTIRDDIRYEKDILTLLIKENEITVLICNNNIDAKLNLSCPNCNKNCTQIKELSKHLKDHHDLKSIVINEEYYCPFVSCKYFIDSGNNKYFTKRKLLKQHLIKVHLPKTVKCTTCFQAFYKKSDLNRHLRECSKQFYCRTCDLSYKVKESYQSHLLRKHPDLYKNIKENKKLLKRFSENMPCVDNKKGKFSFTETLSNLDTDELDRNYTTIETQTAFEDMLSVKPASGDDDSIFFPDSVSDTQTQTWPIEFGLNRSNKETNTSLIPDVIMKETQTCICRNDSPTFSKSFFDPANFISTQTQTAEFSQLSNIKSDVMLSFSSAETQTCFESELEKNRF